MDLNRNANNPEKGVHIALKRSLGLPLITLYGLGTIIGAGIYVLIGEVVAASGFLAPMAFIAAAVVAGFTAFSYAELVSRYPLSGGEAVYVDRAFHKPWLATVTGWAVALVGVVSSATLARGFVGYFELFLSLPDILVITMMLLVICTLAAWGIAQSAWVAAAATLLEVGGLAMVIFIASDSFVLLPDKFDMMLPSVNVQDFSFIGAGAFLAFYAFIGFEDMVNVAEEVKKPSQTLPIAISLALILATVLYVIISMVAVLAVPVSELADNSAPLVYIVGSRSASATVFLSYISLFAVLNGALVQIIMSTRIMYGMATHGLAPRALGLVNRHTRTPIVTTCIVSFVVWIFAVALPLVTLARLTSAITLAIFGGMNIALCRIKYEPHEAGVYIVPYWVPVTGASLSLLMLVSSIWITF